MLRRLFVYVLFAVASLASLAPAAIAATVFPPGLRVGLEPPVGMTPSARFPGFEDTAHNAIITILDLPLSAYHELETAAFNKIQQDLEQPKRESFPFESGIGFLISGTAHQNGVAVRSLVATGAGRWRIRPKSDGTDQRGSAGKRPFGLFGRNHSQGTRKRHVQADAGARNSSGSCPLSSAIWPAFASRRYRPRAASSSPTRRPTTRARSRSWS